MTADQHHLPRPWSLALALWLVLVALLPGAATPPPAAALATPDFFGLVGRDPWYEFDTAAGQPRRPFQEAMLRNIAATGVGWVRIEFHTSYVTTGVARAGAVTFPETDLFVNELAPAYRTKVLALLNSGIISDQPPFNYRIKDLLDPGLRQRYIDAFVARAREIAAHYDGRIGAYEIMNEPNINNELGATTNYANQEIPPAVFGDLLTRTYAAIREVDADVPIIVGGLLKGYPIENGSRYTTNYLQALYAAPAVATYRSQHGRLPFEGVGLHPYPNTALPRSQWLTDTLGLVGAMASVMDDNGDPGRLWLTEIGVKAAPAAQRVGPATADESFQATWLRDLAGALATTYAGAVSRVFWFKYEDFPPESQEQTWGLVRLASAGSDYDATGVVQRAKPAFAALHDLAFVPASTWLFAEGYTATGFDEFLTVQNAGATAALVAVTYLPTGAAPVLRSVLVNPGSRATISVHDLVNCVGRGWPVATRVRATAPVVVERPMYFTYGAGVTGGHVALGATTVGTRWYFAEGYTGTGFDEFLTIQNPSTTATTATITYVFADGGGHQIQSLPVPALSRQTVSVHAVVGRHRAVSIIVESSGGVGIVAERPIYFSYTGGITGGHVAMGVAQPAQTWWFAEGFTGPGFHQYFAILNPSQQPATVTVTYFLTGGRQQQRTVTVAAGKRGTIAVHNAADPGGLGPNEANAARLTSTVPVVVERPLYFRYTLRDGRPVDGGHTVVGATALSTRYQFAEGYTGPGFDQYLTLLNPGSTTNRLRLTFQLTSGGSVTREITVGGGSRETVRVHDPVEGVGPDQAVSTTVVSLDNRPFLAERPMYFVYGPGWTGGHVAIGHAG
jgi:hypothetical protein